MTLAQQAARNRANLEQQAQLLHNERFDRMYRAERNWMLLVLAVLVGIAFYLSMGVIAGLDEGAKPGPILSKSELIEKGLMVEKPRPEKAVRHNKIERQKQEAGNANSKI